MRRYKISTVWTIAALIIISCISFKQTEPWQQNQLIEPDVLATKIKDPNANKPLIICVGPGALIKGSVDVGPANKKENLDKLKQLLSKENKDRDIVIYCGCCPFKNCPNIRPAFTLLNNLEFTNHKLLNLSHNIKVDWLDHGYPVDK